MVALSAFNISQVTKKRLSTHFQEFTIVKIQIQMSRMAYIKRKKSKATMSNFKQ